MVYFRNWRIQYLAASKHFIMHLSTAVEASHDISTFGAFALVYNESGRGGDESQTCSQSQT